MADTYFAIEGNLTRDPEVTYTTGGIPVAKFGLAVNKKWQDRATNETHEQTSFFDIEVWRDQALNVADSCSKGMRVVVTGNIEQQTWETESHDKRSKVVFTAQTVSPSLRWATASVTKTEKGSSNGRAPAMAGAPAAGSAEAEFGDEEPF